MEKPKVNSPPTPPIIKSNWVKRSLTATVLIVYMIVAAYLGIPAIWFSTLLIQTKCYQEIIAIAYKHYSERMPGIPLFRTFNWYFLFLANYYFFGETFAQYLEVLTVKYQILGMLFKYNRLISLCLYLIGIGWFLSLLLKQKRILRQHFSLLAWMHVLCLIIVLQSYMIIQNLFEGLIWVIMPLTLVFLNDIFAYIFGKKYGKTPLIKVSPSKTLEGFLGGGLGSLVLGTIIAWVLCHIDHMVCPTKFQLVKNTIEMSTNCSRSYLFQPVNYYGFNYYPFLNHLQVLTLFASLIAPFGGFCASGFKRAFKMKDFGDTIPGHGGVMDRFDCQYLMASFVNVYIISFVRNYSVEKFLAKVLNMNEEVQLEFFHVLKQNLTDQGLLN
ncbi:phosphatidate cytidylyltransferase, photoreceptor-specific-like isoform X2 [Anthonomus grandis grandis]|nr:phosphatidate cytidylyltransferase, photoreceptor-specific-like isoform X2 [Anthonomus grandis grandis]XP_050307277.1 phosphatidate cytidylyltransferase, photoreceptor-specific-like isoform X2 [Anthonomus grandis grandis]XP_050307278.1 phosphatidate cytidylyltransferase, photoreceptor-specific-like isoform X2 [Anthonomus grandis grandis]